MIFLKSETGCTTFPPPLITDQWSVSLLLLFPPPPRMFVVKCSNLTILLEKFFVFWNFFLREGGRENRILLSKKCQLLFIYYFLNKNRLTNFTPFFQWHFTSQTVPSVGVWNGTSFCNGVGLNSTSVGTTQLRQIIEETVQRHFGDIPTAETVQQFETIIPII